MNTTCRWVYNSDIHWNWLGDRQWYPRFRTACSTCRNVRPPSSLNQNENRPEQRLDAIVESIDWITARLGCSETIMSQDILLYSVNSFGRRRCRWDVLITFKAEEEGNTCALFTFSIKNKIESCLSTLSCVCVRRFYVGRNFGDSRMLEESNSVDRMTVKWLLNFIHWNPAACLTQ